MRAILLNLVNKNKKMIAILVAAILYLGFMSTVHADSNFSTVYHVYVGNQHLGAVNNQTVVDQYIQEQIKQKEQEYDDLRLAVNEEISYIPEKSFEPVFDNNEVLNKLTNQLTFSVKAIKLEIDDITVGYFKDVDVAHEVLQTLQAKYIPEDKLEELNLKPEVKVVKQTESSGNLTEDKKLLMLKLRKDLEKSTDKVKETKTTEVNVNELKDLLIGENEIIDVWFSEDVFIQEVKVSPSDITSVDTAMEKLEQGKQRVKAYEVDQGDTLSSIVEKFNITMEQLLENNKELEKNELALQVGQELQIPYTGSVVDVVLEEVEAQEREIEYTTKYVESSDLYQGQQKVIEPGQPGVMKVYYKVQKVNGKVTNRVVLEEEILTEPKEAVVAKGTKLMPSTGDLGWPTAGGIITSYMGYRWGGYHKGIDISGVSNRTIYAADDGYVKLAGYQSNGYGNRIEISHSNGFVTTYSHLSAIYVSSGQQVKRGQAIGVMGRTGNSTGVHLHFEAYVNGSAVNPLNYY